MSLAASADWRLRTAHSKLRSKNLYCLRKRERARSQVYDRAGSLGPAQCRCGTTHAARDGLGSCRRPADAGIGLALFVLELQVFQCRHQSEAGAPHVAMLDQFDDRAHVVAQTVPA